MSDVKPSFADKSLGRLGEALRDRTSRKELIWKFGRALRWLLAFTGFSYASTLLLLALSLRLIGENNVTLAFLLYLPHIIWLLPLPALLLPTLIWQRKVFLTLILTSTFFIWSVMGYRLGSDEPLPQSGRTADMLTVLTYNRGQHANQSLQPFKNLTHPDLLLMQEASGRAPGYAKAEAYQGFTHSAGQDQFILLSKYPITDTSTLSLPFGERQETVAARFEVNWNGQSIAVYSVHLPTPRDTLLYYRRGAFLYGLLGLPGTTWGEKRKNNQAYWDARLELSRALIEQLKKEKLPMIVVGDFNAPHAGYNHRLFNSFLQDSHKKSGSGLGYTFPGTTRNPLSAGGPWMRIDYIFCDQNWKCLRNTAEKNRRSQHRAVSATLKLK